MYKVFFNAHYDSPGGLERWLERLFEEDGLFLIATNGEIFVFVKLGDLEGEMRSFFTLLLQHK